MYSASLEKITSSHRLLRTDVVIGEYPEAPEEGKPFVMYAESLSFEGGVRMVRTTPIVAIESKGENVWLFTTENSTYLLRAGK